MSLAPRGIGAPDGPVTPGFLLLLLVIPLVWAGGFWAGAPAVHQAGPVLTTFLRFAIAAVCLFPLLALTRPKGWIRLDGRLLRYAAVASLVGGILYHLLFYAGLAHVDPVRGAVIISMNPALNALLESTWLRRPLGRRFWVGLAVAMGGALLALSAGRDLGALFSAWSRWDTLLVAAGVSWATYGVLIQRLREPGWDGAWMSAWFVLGTAVASGVLAFPELHRVATFSARDWAPHVYLGLASTALAYSLYSMGITRLGAAKAALYSFLVPVLAALLRPLIEGEPVKGLELVGSVLVFTGLGVALARKRVVGVAD